MPVHSWRMRCVQERTFLPDGRATRIYDLGAPERVGAGTGFRRAAPVPALPCLNSNNCTDHLGKSPANGRKSAFALEQNVLAFLLVAGLNQVGFLTLTFAEHITDPKEAQKRWHSLLTHVLQKRYGRILRVFERQHSGRIHYHVLIQLKEDIRTGFDFEAARLRRYGSANEALRAEWAFWRKTASRYRFGRTELMPIKSPEAMGKYVGKYIGKHMDARLVMDKGVRLVQCSRGWKRCSSSFAFASPGGWVYRAKLRQFAVKRGCVSFDQLRRRFGRSWAYQFRDLIKAEVLRWYPTSAHARADNRDCTGFPADCTNLFYS